MRTIKITEEQFRAFVEYMVREEFAILQNASPSEDDEGKNMIEHWEKKTGIDLHGRKWTCPKCGNSFAREGLDGAHVVFPDGNNAPQFITPLCLHCNRERGDELFVVERKYIVPAH